MNPFQSVTSNDLGFTAGDILNSVFSLVQVLMPILIIGLAFMFVPMLINAMRQAAGGSRRDDDDDDHED